MISSQAWHTGWEMLTDDRSLPCLVIRRRIGRRGVASNATFHLGLEVLKEDPGQERHYIHHHVTPKWTSSIIASVSNSSTIPAYLRMSQLKASDNAPASLPSHLLLLTLEPLPSHSNGGHRIHRTLFCPSRWEHYVWIHRKRRCCNGRQQLCRQFCSE